MERGIASGYKDKSGKLCFYPDNKAKRADIAVMLAKTLGLEGPTDGFKSKFTDIGKHSAKNAIMALEEKGLLGGYTVDGKVLFKPDGTITRAEIGVLMIRIQGLK